MCFRQSEQGRVGRDEDREVNRQIVWGLGVRTLTFTLSEMEGSEQKRDVI